MKGTCKPTVGISFEPTLKRRHGARWLILDATKFSYAMLNIKRYCVNISAPPPLTVWLEHTVAHIDRVNLDSRVTGKMMRARFMIVLFTCFYDHTLIRINEVLKNKFIILEKHV